MIEKINNPKTELYLKFKNFVLSPQFSWFWISESTPRYDIDGYENISHFSHTFLSRSGPGDIFYTKENCQHIGYAHNVFLEVARANGISPLVVYRINANAVFPTSSMKYTVPHYDHVFPHKNMLIYLTNPNGGDTVCEGESFLAEEDDVIIMEGEHCHKPPSNDRRIVLIYTFLDLELRNRCEEGLKLLKENKMECEFK
jgi:hypothetical protein